MNRRANPVILMVAAVILAGELRSTTGHLKHPNTWQYEALLMNLVGARERTVKPERLGA